MPLVRGEVKQINEAVFAEVNYHAAYEPKRAVRTSRWKYTKRFGDRRTPVLPNCDDGPSKSLWLEFGWRDHVLPEEALFDLIFDPAEQNNLAADPHARHRPQRNARPSGNMDARDRRSPSSWPGSRTPWRTSERSLRDFAQGTNNRHRLRK